MIQSQAITERQWNSNFRVSFSWSRFQNKKIWLTSPLFVCFHQWKVFRESSLWSYVDNGKLKRKRAKTPANPIKKQSRAKTAKLFCGGWFRIKVKLYRRQKKWDQHSGWREWEFKLKRGRCVKKRQNLWEFKRRDGRICEKFGSFRLSS